ncbi:MAG: transposase [Microbacterium sp.]
MAGQRGAYGKGIAKREEILAAALEVIGDVGVRSASVRQIAEVAGLSQTALFHYFESKEQLFTEVLRKRDEVNRARQGIVPGRLEDLSVVHERFVNAARHNLGARGLVLLYSQLSVDAAEPAHPARSFFVSRGGRFRGNVAQMLRHAQGEGRVTPEVDADTLAALIHAVLDGAQLLALADDRVEAVAVIDALFRLLAAGRSPDADSGPVDGGREVTAVLSDAEWARIRAVLPAPAGGRGRPRREDRVLVEGMIWRMRTGSSWRRLPARFGPWQTLWKRHRRYVADGTWEAVLAALAATEG